MTTVHVRTAVAELTRNVREVQEFMTAVKPAQVTEADRAALGALLEDLALLISAAKRLE